MNELQIKIEVPQTISSKPDKYHGWSTVCRLTDGQLIVGFSGGRAGHVCPFGQVEIIRSTDNGKTWSDHEILVNGPLDDRDTGIVQTHKGTILVTWFTSLAWEDKLKEYGQRGYYHRRDSEKIGLTQETVAQWKKIRDGLSEDTKQRELGQWLIRSEDGGRTWSQKVNTIVNSPHGPIQLSDGRLLYMGKRLWTPDKEIGACESTDDGKTWRWIAKVPFMAGHDHRLCGELHAVQTADGRIVAHIRNHNEDQYQYETLQTESTDGGRTWSPAHPIGVWGYPSHLLKLKDDRLLMTYSHRRDPYGQQARVSSDSGRTWSQPIILTGGGEARDLGYPSTVQLEDDSLLTIWYEAQSPGENTEIRQIGWRL